MKVPGPETRKHLVMEVDLGQTTLAEIKRKYGVGPETIAAWRQEMQQAEEARGQGAAPAQQLLLCGLGIDPPYSTTLETVAALLSCSTVYPDGLDEESLRFLREIGVKLAQGEPAPAQGETVALVTAGAPLERSERARRAFSSLEARRALPAVSAVDAFFARCRYPMDSAFTGIQACSLRGLLGKDAVLDPAYPTVVDLSGKAPTARETKSLARRLGAAYGPEGRALLLRGRGPARELRFSELAVLNAAAAVAVLPREAERRRALKAADVPSAPFPAGTAQRLERRLSALGAGELRGYDIELARLIAKILRALEGRPVPEAASYSVFGLGLLGEEHLTVEAVALLAQCDVVYFRDHDNPRLQKFLSLLAAELRFVDSAQGAGPLEEIEALAKSGRRVALGQRAPAMAIGGRELSLAESLAREGRRTHVLTGPTSLGSMRQLNEDPDLAVRDGLQMRDADLFIARPRLVNPSWPLVVFFAMAPGFCLRKLQGALQKLYPKDHECLFLAELVDASRLRLGALGALDHVMTGREVLILPPAGPKR